MQPTGKKSGGSFIMDETDFREVFTPEDFTEEHRMIAHTTEEFVEREILTLGEAAKKLNYDVSRKILQKSGEVGLLGASLPEEYGGFGLDGVRFALMREKLNTKSVSLTMTIGGQVGIGALPIVFFGTPEQREKYLPGLVSGELATAFALTEPSAGSDASGIKSTAVLSPDGKHYVINGSKVFITNAGFADIFVVFAKVNGKDFSAFIVERNMKGVTVGPEEQKMGLKASSTCSVTFDDVHVPVENLLGEIGKGHLIAFNTLNFGRLSVGANCLGNIKDALEVSVKYANQRVQFGRKISSFPLIGKKLADINIRAYVLESMVYRTASLYDIALSTLDFSDPDLGSKSQKAISEFLLESAVTKVFGSETLDFAADEGLQIHGGYGYIQEYHIEEIYRDARIKRIFEGANEIVRIFITSNILKRMEKGQLPSMKQAMELPAEELARFADRTALPGLLEQEDDRLGRARRIYAFTLACARNKFGAKLDAEQEISGNLADIAIQLYAMDSAILRTKKMINRSGEQAAQNAVLMTRTFVYEAFELISALSKNTLIALQSGDELMKNLSILNELSQTAPYDTIASKRQIAAAVIEAEKYVV